MPRRLCPVAAVAACLIAASSAAAATPQFSRSDVRELAIRMAEPWPNIVRS